MHAEDRRAGEGAWPRRLMYVCIEPQLKPQPPPSPPIPPHPPTPSGDRPPYCVLPRQPLQATALEFVANEGEAAEGELKRKAADAEAEAAIAREEKEVAGVRTDSRVSRVSTGVTPPCIAGIHRRYLIRTPSPRSRVSSGGISSTRTPPAHVLPPHTSAETPVRIGERDSRITQSAIGQNHSENRAACPLICEVTLRTCSIHNRTEVNGHPRSRVHTESGSVLFCSVHAYMAHPSLANTAHCSGGRTHVYCG